MNIVPFIFLIWFGGETEIVEKVLAPKYNAKAEVVLWDGTQAD